MSDDLDFSQPAGAPKPQPARKPPAPSGPLYIPAVARSFFESAGKEESLPAGTVFFSENEKASRLFLKRDKMYLLLDGRVVLVVKGRPIGEPKVGEIFGEMAAISDSPRSATAVAQTACRVISLDDKGFATALSKKPEFALMMLGTLIVRLRAMIARLSGVP
jgi:CRP-like cAMP-binding protein